MAKNEGPGPKAPNNNQIKANFHAIVQQKKSAGMPGHQALATTYAAAFPGQSIYKASAGNASPATRKASGLKGIKAPKKPRSV